MVTLELADWAVIIAALGLSAGIAVRDVMLARKLRRYRIPEWSGQWKDRNEDEIMNDEAAIESEIQRKGLTAPRLTPADIDAQIMSEQYHVFDGTTLTVCCLTLRNGFTVTGESAAASPENFDREIGQRIARENARQKIWPLEGYTLRNELSGRAYRGL